METGKITPIQKNGGWMSKCRDWLSFLVLIGAVIAGMWLVVRPAIDSQYFPAAQGRELRHDLAALEARLNSIDTRLAELQTDVKWLRSRGGGNPPEPRPTP